MVIFVSLIWRKIDIEGLLCLSVRPSLWKLNVGYNFAICSYIFMKCSNDIANDNTDMVMPIPLSRLGTYICGSVSPFW